MERDFAHEHDMEMLRREQLRADCGGDMADDDEWLRDYYEDEKQEFLLFDDDYWSEDGDQYMGDPDEYFEEDFPSS